MLDELCVQLRADFRESRFALVAVETAGPDLDEFMRGQRAADFGDHGLGQALFAEMDDRIEGVRARLQRLALARVYRLPLDEPLTLRSSRNTTSRSRPSPENCTCRLYSMRARLYIR